jgi:hypothetical protein
MVRYIDDYSLKAQMSFMVQKCLSDQTGRMIMQQSMPPTSMNTFWQNYGSELAVIILAINLI